MRWIAAGIVLGACWAASGCATAMVGIAVLTNSRHFSTESTTPEFASVIENYSGPDVPQDEGDVVTLSDDEPPPDDPPSAIASDGLAVATDPTEEIPLPVPAAEGAARPGAAQSDIDRFNRPVADVPLDIHPPQGVLPVDQAAEAFAGGAADPRAIADWPQVVCSYTPWTICYRPLYFEEIALERYGATHGLVQPAISGAHFFGSVALLPYKMTVRRPRSCVCSNGFSRPGDCPPPGYSDCVWRWDAALVEAAAVTGFVFILP